MSKRDRDDRKKAKRRAKRERAKQREDEKARRQREHRHAEITGQPLIKLPDPAPGEPTVRAQIVGAGDKAYRVPLSALGPAPIRHASLPVDLLEKIRVLFHTVGRYVYDEKYTLEQWETGFMRDAHPEREVAVWSRIACAWKQYHVRHLEDEVRNYKYEQRLVTALIGISTGSDQLGVPPLVEQRLRDCWAHPWQGEDQDGKE